jgi:AbrB family looped-hinge helix DNA binding protein
MTLMKVRPKGQITLPDAIRKAARLSEGDYLEVSVEAGTIVMRPKKLIDADQAWFWTDEWQKGEREASRDIARGRVRRSVTGDEFIDTLG